jgi:hypothetical protein
MLLRRRCLSMAHVFIPPFCLSAVMPEYNKNLFNNNDDDD